MTQAAETAPTTTDQIIDRLLCQIEEAWVTEEFDAIIEANWPTGPPEPPPTAGPVHAEPPRPGSPAPVSPRGELHETRDHPRVWGRQRAPSPSRPRNTLSGWARPSYPPAPATRSPEEEIAHQRRLLPTHRIGALQQHP